jgi:hypothetical protein
MAMTLTSIRRDAIQIRNRLGRPDRRNHNTETLA